LTKYGINERRNIMTVVGLLNLLLSLGVDQSYKLDFILDGKAVYWYTLEECKNGAIDNILRRTVRSTVHNKGEDIISVYIGDSSVINNEDNDLYIIVDSANRMYSEGLIKSKRLASNITTYFKKENDELFIMNGINCKKIEVYTEDNIDTLVTDYPSLEFGYAHKIIITRSGKITHHMINNYVKMKDDPIYEIFKEPESSRDAFTFLYFEYPDFFEKLSEDEIDTRKREIENLCYSEIRKWKIKNIDTLW